MEPKNYIVIFMSQDCEYVTARQAAEVVKAWGESVKFIVVCGNVYATHQIRNISRLQHDQELMTFHKAKIIDRCAVDYEDQWQKIEKDYSIEKFLQPAKLDQPKND